MPRLVRLGAALAVAGAATATSAAPAAAADGQPCLSPYDQPGIGTVQKCPIVLPDRGYVPVHRFEDGRTVEVGRLNHGGSGNWFVCQDDTPDGVTPAVYTDPDTPALRNRFWAYTLSDDNQWGWVNQIYFAGGVNDEADGGLRACDPPPTAPAPVPTPAPTPPPAPTQTVDLQAGVQCTPPGQPVITTMTVRRRAGQGKPRVLRVRFFVKQGRDVAKVDRRAPFRAGLVPRLAAGTRARVYARVTYRRPGERRLRTRTVSKPFEICA